MVREGSQDRGTALHRSLVGDDHIWGLSEQLLATVVDSLQVGNWQFAAANSKTKPKKPKPIPRPGVGTRQGVKVGGDTAVPLSQAQEIFARHNPAAHAVAVAPPADTSP